MRTQKGAITVYLSLIWILLVAFIGSVLESASLQVAKNNSRTDVERGMECVFAEYQKELLENYGIFAFDGGYESGNYGESVVIDRINFYSEGNAKHSIERIKFLSDENGKMFYEQVCTLMEEKYGISFLKDKLGMTSFWKSRQDLAKEMQLTETVTQKDLEQILEQGTNPTLEDLKQSMNDPILTLVMPEGKTVSEKQIELGEMLSKRERNQGYGVFETNREDTALSMLLLGEYILENFTSAVNKNGNALRYEVEYLIGGKGSDRENLEVVTKKLLWLRLVPNYAAVQGDIKKRTEAETLAVTVCTLLAVPVATEVVAQVILFAWAYEESINDIQKLLAGERIPLLTNGTNALSYKEYLRILLFFEKKETLCMRAMDLIEVNLREIHGQRYFHVDQCVVKMEISSECRFRRGITYRFRTCRTYQ